MDQQRNHSQHDKLEDADVEGRRELVRKLGKFAAYAAPFTVLALKGNAQASGGGGSGGIHPGVAKSQAARR